jgi:hypothetical protein
VPAGFLRLCVTGFDLVFDLVLQHARSPAGRPP